MLTNTFCHLPGIGPSAEERLWRTGILSWHDLERRASEVFSAPKAIRITDGLHQSRAALADGDIMFFLRRLDPTRIPRVYPHLGDTPTYLDIETTGLRRERARVTTITAYRHGGFHVFVRGANLQEFPAIAESESLWITYNGARFDVPFIQDEFGTQLDFSNHLDLCPVIRALGSRGGLKGAEKALGVQRKHTECRNGADAVRLWQQHLDGTNADALKALVIYNAQDVLALEALLAQAWRITMAAFPLRTYCAPLNQPAPETAWKTFCSLTTEYTRHVVCG